MVTTNIELLGRPRTWRTPILLDVLIAALLGVPHSGVKGWRTTNEGWSQIMGSHVQRHESLLRIPLGPDI